MVTRCPAPTGPRSFSFAVAHRFAAVLALAIAVLPTFWAAPAAHAQTLATHRYVNVVNRDFETVSDGPQSAIVIDAPANATDADEKALTTLAARNAWRSQARSIAPAVARLRKSRFFRNSGAFPISTIIATRRNGAIVTPQTASSAAGASTRAAGLTRAALGGGTLTFSYTGFNSTDQAFLQQIVATAYPAIVSLYGQPAFSGSVEVVNAGTVDTNPSLTDSQYVSYGVYDASHNRILLPTFAVNESFVQAFILNMIHAFHGSAVFQYDAWEQGFARAATAVIARQTSGTIGITDPSAAFTFDLLQLYDLLNQPSLGNSTFIPPSQANRTLDSNGSMLIARLGMSGAAWLKVYIENPDFFRQFNAAYYAQANGAASPALAGNVPALRAIAGTLLPNGVEATPWTTWYPEQYILNTAYSSGEQLYAFESPDDFDSTDPTDGQATGLFLTYYIGLKNGDESLPASATAYATYLDANNARLDLEISSESAAITNGEGALTPVTHPTQGVDSGRITANIHVGNASTTVYIISGFTGDFQAAILGPSATGSVTVNEKLVLSTTTRTATGSITNAGFGVNLKSDTFDLAATTISIANGGATSTYRRNTGDGLAYVVIRRGNTGGGVVTATHTFATSDLPNLVTFPVQPLNSIVDQALGLSGSAFVLSYWNVTQSAYETLVPGQPSIAPITTGRGYWFKLEPNSANPTTAVSVTGTAASTDTDFVLTLPYGWNMIGSPFATPIDTSSILVQYLQNGVISFSDAVSKSLIAAKPFAWDPTTGAYASTSTIDGTNWQGYWLRVLVPNGVTLLFPGPDATSRAAAVHRAALTRSVSGSSVAAAPDWTLNLRATQAASVMLTRSANSANARVATAVLGVGRAVKPVGFDNRYDLEAPPAVVPTLAMRFAHPEWSDGKSTGGYVADFRSATAASTKTTWDLEVQTPNAGPVTVTWDGLADLPRTTQLMLVDKAAGTRTPLKTRSSYAFTASAGGTRVLQIVAEPQRSMPLTITPLLSATTRAATTHASRSASVSIGYMVSTEADVTVEFSSLAGRTVRHLPLTRATSLLGQRAVWDGKGDSGQPLPPGLYRVDITARTDDGTQAHFTRSVMLLN